ncbi:MAG TPA: hypothetical protein VFU21_24595, partial [Kofleriaceae bacterium]|nr:hypothetical protein [Kofleriaceae bacterium]
VLAALSDDSPEPRATTVPIRGGKAKGVRAPRQWATGTSPATNRPSRRELGIQGTGPTASLDVDPGESLTNVDRPTRILAPVEIGGGIVGRRLGPSRVTWVVAAVGAGAVLGLGLWAMTRGGDSSPRAKEAAAAAPGDRQPIGAMAPGAVAPAPIPTASPLRLPEPASTRARASASDDGGPERGKKKKARDAVAAMPAPATAATRAASIPAPVTPAIAPASAVPARAPSLVESELRPLPIPVKEPPAKRFAAAAATASATPLLVTPDRARRRSGSIPVLRGTRSANPIRAITAKLCVDRAGKVTSVSILSKVDTPVKHGLTDALERWRYEPIVEGGTAVPACFATTFRVTQK